jgi:hypothetical protein
MFFCFFVFFVILNLSGAFLCRVLFDTRQSFCRVSKKVLGKELFADKMFTEYFLLSVTLAKCFAECKMAFAECLRHSAKNASPVVLGLVRFQLNRSRLRGIESLSIQF